MAKKKTIKNVSPILESNLVAERIDDTYETKLRSTTTFNKHAIVETEVTMKKPDDLAANYVADEAVVKVNGVEVSGGGGYPEPTGTIEIKKNGTVDVKDYANANVNVPSSTPVLVRMRGKIRASGSYYYALDKTTGEEKQISPIDSKETDTVLYEANLDDFSITDAEIDNILTEISTRTGKDKYKDAISINDIFGVPGMIIHKYGGYTSNPNSFILNYWLVIEKEA